MDSEASGNILSNCIEQVNKLEGENQSLKTQLRSLKEIIERRNQDINNLIKSNREEAEKLNNKDLFVPKVSYEGDLFLI